MPFQLPSRISLFWRRVTRCDDANRDLLIALRDQAVEERSEVAAKAERLARERGELEASRNRAAAERDGALAADRERAAEYKRVWLRFRPVEQLAGHRAIAKTAEEVDDADLVDRIISAYKLADQTAVGSTESMWFRFLAEPKKPIHEALMRGDRDYLVAILRQPDLSALFFGFEYTYHVGLPKTQDLRDFWEYQSCYDTLCSLAEAICLKPLPNPENYYHVDPPEPVSPDQLIEEIENAFGFPLQFPNPFIGEIGLATSRGVITHRAVQALYQSWRIADLTKQAENPRVLEIGAGLGRTAYYAIQFGIRDYTVIDLPITAVAQAYFLGRALGPDAICLFGEDRPGIRVLPPAAFLDSNDHYDLVVNANSLTEMAVDTARAYCAAIRERASLFLSINHEVNAFTARTVCVAAGLKAVSRSPYWMRRGYVEELFRSG